MEGAGTGSYTQVGGVFPAPRQVNLAVHAHTNPVRPYLETLENKDIYQDHPVGVSWLDYPTLPRMASRQGTP